MPKKLDARDGWILTAALVVPSNKRGQLGRALTIAILENPQWQRTGLQANYLELKNDPKTGFVKTRLLCTKAISNETVESLLNSMPEVAGVFDLKIQKVKWTNGYHLEYYADFPEDEDVYLPPEMELLSSGGVWPQREVTDEELEQSAARSRPKNKILANNRAVWEHHQTVGYQRNIKSTHPKKTS